MGTAPHGLVFYGFALIDEYGEPLDVGGPWKRDGSNTLYSDWEEYYLERKGEPSRPDSNNILSYEPGEWRAEWKEWREKRQAMLDAANVTVELAGYDECLIYVVCIKETWTRAEWAEIKPLTTLETKPKWAQQLRDWCEVMGIEYQEPGWYVASLYF